MFVCSKYVCMSVCLYVRMFLFVAASGDSERVCLACLECCVGCIENAVEFLNKYAYTQVQRERARACRVCVCLELLLVVCLGTGFHS